MTINEFLQKFSNENNETENRAAAMIILLRDGLAETEQDLRDKLYFCCGMIYMMAVYGDLTLDEAEQINKHIGEAEWPLKDELPKRRPHLKIVR